VRCPGAGREQRPQRGQRRRVEVGLPAVVVGAWREAALEARAVAGRLQAGVDRPARLPAVELALALQRHAGHLARLHLQLGLPPQREP